MLSSFFTLFWKNLSLNLCLEVLILVIDLSSGGILFHVFGPR